MSSSSHDKWLDIKLPKHERLTNAVVSILENLLREHEIDFLAVSGRTKKKKSALEKISRKGYSDLDKQFTDLSGVRVVVFLESDVRRVCDLIQTAFSIDKEKSLDKDALLSADRIGYRSIHYVCDLADKRALVDEYKSLSGLNFEVQVRTVLQHAWAELTHDRNYKFSGKLPRDLERKLYLYAGLLEIADRGFDETAASIDAYSETLKIRTSHGDLDIEISSLSLTEFFLRWAEESKCPLDADSTFGSLNDLVSELNDFGITRLSQLHAIALPEYAKAVADVHEKANIFGAIRDWMLLKDWRRFVNEVNFKWSMGHEDSLALNRIMDNSDYDEMISYFRSLDESGEENNSEAEL